MNDDQIRWSVTDPLGNEIVLYENDMNDHIIGEHSTKDAAIRVAIEEQVKYSLRKPRFILKDRKFTNRWRYFDMVFVPLNQVKAIKGLGIIIEVEVKPFRVVTWYARRAIDEQFRDEEMIYDASVERTSGV